MPGLDGTGPSGDQNWPCRRMYGFGAGFRRGFGGRAGFGPGFGSIQPLILDKEDQKKILSAQLAELEAEKQAIEVRLKQLTDQA